MDIQAALYHTWFCSNVNCTKEKREGKTFEWAMKKAEKNVNTAGKRTLNTSKRYVTENLEIETKMYKKADNFSCHFYTSLFSHVYML